MQDQTATVVAQDRVTSFSVAEGDPGPPQSMKIFGSVFVVLWLGMLGLVFLARRRQLALKLKLDRAETLIRARPLD